LGILFNNSLIGWILTFILFALQLFVILYTISLFVFLMPLIAIENRNVFAAIRKSILLAWNHWWRLFTVQLTPWLFYTVVVILMRYALNLYIHIYFLDSTTHDWLPTITHLLVFALLIPWVAAL